MTDISADTSSDRLFDRNFLIAVLCQTCFVIAATLMAHYARWIEFLGGDLRQVGWIMGITALLGLALRPWMAQWINRLGARSMWAVGYGLFAVMSLANLFLNDLGPMIYVVRSALVLAPAIVFASCLTYITQTTPPQRRIEAIGILGVGGFIGMLIGPLLGDLFLSERARGNFELVFAAAAITSLLPAGGLYFLRPSTSLGKNSSVRLSEFITLTRRHWPGTILVVDFAFGVCMTAPFVFMASFVDAASLRLDGMSVIGLFFFCYAGVGIVVRVGSRRLPDRIGASRVLLAGMVFMSAGMFAFGIVDAGHSWLIVVPALLTGTGHSLMYHTMASLTIERFPSEVRGTGSALALMLIDFGAFVGSPILGWVGAQYGYGALFGTIGALTAGCGLIYGLSRVATWAPHAESSPMFVSLPKAEVTELADEASCLIEPPASRAPQTELCD